VLAWAGYVERAERQTPQTLTAIRLLIALVPALVLLGAIIVAWRYPLTRKRHQEIQAELAQRRAMPADPQSGGR
jgi:GPH family glycoside/pentoside/hexuronide:cation symporter